MVSLDFSGLLYNSLVAACNTVGEKLIPFAVRKYIIIKYFELPAQIGNEGRLVVDRKIFITLRLQ